MTNGEKIKAMFSSVIVGFITESQVGIYFVKNQHSATVFSLDWWNAEYIEPVIRDNGVKDELNRVKNELESTTKNDLAVDCVSRKEVEKLVYRFLIKATDENIAFYEHFLDLPSVTPPKIAQIAGIEYDENKLKELVNKAVLTVTPQEPRKGEWLRMSDLSEQEDDRYKCSRCGNVIHRKNKMDLYTFDSWCGRCGSDNGRHINYEVEE